MILLKYKNIILNNDILLLTKYKKTQDKEERIIFVGFFWRKLSRTHTQKLICLKVIIVRITFIHVYDSVIVSQGVPAP